MQSLTNAFNSLSHTITEAINPHAPVPLTYTRADILLLEEAERERRMHNAIAVESKANAAKASALISSLKYPYFQGSFAGSKRLTARAEEHERARRLLTKPELALRKANANRTAGMIRSLGWPFIRTSDKQGPLYVFADETSLLEEEERRYRVQNPLQAQLAKNNAALTSNALRWGWTGLPLGTKRYTRSMEEKERARRLTDREELSLAAEKSYQVSGLIRKLGFPFFVQDQHVDTLNLEQEEQRRRLADKTEQVKARQHAAIVSRLLPMWAAGKSGKRAEQERARRMSNAGEQQQAMQIAKQLSTIVAGSVLDEQEEKERVRRIRHAEFDAARAREIASLIQGLQFSKANANSLYNREAHRRLRDLLGERIARQNAHKIAALMAAQPNFGLEQPLATNIAQLEEDERKQRMYDYTTQQNQMRNARKASDMIKLLKVGRKQSPFFQTEKERHRRMVDAGQQAMSMANAKQVSNMLRGNSAVLRKAPARSVLPVLPMASPAALTLTTDLSPAFAAPLRNVAETNPLLSQAQVPVSFFPETSLPRDAPADFMPPAETLREALPFQGELLNKTRTAPPAVLPFKNELLEAASARPESVPRQALPFTNELTSGPTQLRSLLPQQQLPFTNELLSAGTSLLHPKMPQQQALPFRDELLSTDLSQLKPHLPQQQVPFKNELLATDLSQLKPHLPQQQVPFKEELLNRGPAVLHSAAPLPVQQAQPLLQNPQQQISSMPLYGHSFLPELEQTVPRAVAITPVASAPAPLVSTNPFVPEMSTRSVPQQDSFAPISRSIPQQESFAPISRSIPQQESFLPATFAPISAPLAAPISTPISAPLAAPISTPISAPLAAPISAPILAAPLAKAPMGSAPILSAPMVSSHSAPSAYLAPALSANLPYAVPVHTGNLLSTLASTASPAPVAPGLGLSASTISAPLYGAPSNGTFYSAAGAHVLSEQQRRRLDKQAMKHNRKAQKDNSRAEKLLQKAEKLHLRGKDARAEKKENRAEQKVISSKQHALWANDLLHKQQQAAQLPQVAAPAPTVFRPAM